ncbi:FAD:protein FMN transferase [Chitinophaga barathri]|uniref:FAD:protein FMN transferase n=1 Tax=Chitinophaga barathri TaxID=1647451 RepID=UPI000EA22760|nr:FAD:protein FMN transferase [Chitinophaga barathri]
MMYLAAIWMLLQNGPLVKLEGFAQGTVWHMQYEDGGRRNFKTQADSIFEVIDGALSTYRADSEISSFNQFEDWRFQSGHFYEVLQHSADIYKATGGAFDPTVMPLVEAYREGKRSGRDWTWKADSLLQYVGFQYIFFDRETVRKTKPDVRLDFDGIAQGYTVDVLARYLEAQGVQRYMTEVGGEVRCKGTWEIGIEDPQQPGKDLLGIKLTDAAISTAGNYQNFYTANGRTYGHIIHPKIGFVHPDSLLSATIIAPDAVTADGFDTPCLVLGFEGSKQLLRREKNLQAILLYKDHNGHTAVYMTDGIKALVVR